MQPGDVIALNNGRTAACSASIVTATPTITGLRLLGNVRVKAEIDRRVDAYSRAAAIESAGKDNRQDIDDSSVVTLIFEVEDLKRAEAFFTSDDLREAMQNSGVVGKPDVYFLKG